MSHSTKNRMKPNTAKPCMARSSRAMAVRGPPASGAGCSHTARAAVEQLTRLGASESGCGSGGFGSVRPAARLRLTAEDLRRQSG